MFREHLRGENGCECIRQQLDRGRGIFGLDVVGGAGVLRWWLLGLSVVGKGECNRRVLDPATCFVVSGWNSTQAFVEDTVERVTC
jgi:hypothetical protein